MDRQIALVAPQFMISNGGSIMSESVVLKSNRYGINLLLDNKIPFETLLKDIIEKFKESEKFFKGSQIALAFEGRSLTNEEQKRIVNEITDQTTVQIICILDQDDSMANKMKEKLEEGVQENLPVSELPANNNGQFYKGTLRSGQTIESEGSIIILGDVNPGAKVIAKGNIVVLGSLKGNAYAGAGGDYNSFVAALDMDPLQIKIADIIGRSSDKAVWSRKSRTKLTEPQLALLIDGCICINPITKGFVKNI